MNTPASDGSRDPAIEDPTNTWLIHPLSRTLLGWAVRHGISANMVSTSGLVFGAAAALAYLQWQHPSMATIGLLLSLFWLVADGLDGMIARATGTSSAAGRVLDGLCDHGVFLCLYLALGWSIGFSEAWPPMLAAGIAHAVQSSLYEAERARYHRRIRGDGGTDNAPAATSNPGVRLYDAVFHALDRWAQPMDRRLRESERPDVLAARYRTIARRPMRAMVLLSANTRVIAIFCACLAGDPKLFWWFEIGPLTIVAVLAILWHRRIEAGLLN